MYVLKNLTRLDSLPDRLREKIFEKIFSVAEIAKLTIEEYEQYIDSLKTYRDWKNSLDTARDEGIAKGKAEGIAEGEKLKTIEIAKNLLNLGISIDKIRASTGLSKEEIEKI
jgi:predicted transposase/invertase (TIGR01784 family)